MTKYVQQPENSLSSSRMKGAFFAPPTCACAVRIKMAAKRGADKLLTQDNWDQEEEDEEVSDLFHSSQFVLTFLFDLVEEELIFCLGAGCKCRKLFLAWRANISSVYAYITSHIF